MPEETNNQITPPVVDVVDLRAETAPSLSAEPATSAVTGAIQSESLPQHESASSPTSDASAMAPSSDVPQATSADLLPVASSSLPLPVATPAPSSATAIPVAGLTALLLKAKTKLQFRKRQKLDKILNLARQKGRIKNDEVEKLVKVSDKTATRYLQQLVKEGTL